MSSIPSSLGIDHLAFTVPHLDESVAFFRDVLGAEVVYELDPLHDPRGSWMRTQLGVHERAVARIAMLRMGPVTNVELFEYRTPDESPRPPGHGDWGGRHLGIAVTDLDAAARHLRSVDGIRLLGDPLLLPGSPDARGRFLYVETPVGLLMRLQEVPDEPPGGETAASAFGPCAEWYPAGSGIPTARNVDHIGLTVPDLPTAERFFREHLGAELVGRFGPLWLDADTMARLAVPAAGVVQQSLLRVGPTSNVELLQFEVPGQRQWPPANSDHGGHHLAFAVRDVDEASGYLNSLRHIEPLGTPQTEDRGAIAGTRWQYFRTSWGLHVEIVDMPPGVPLDRAGSAERFELGAAALR